MFNTDKYRSVEWQKGGRAFPSLDCFGIVNEIRRDLALAPWPEFAGITKDDSHGQSGSQHQQHTAQGRGIMRGDPGHHQPTGVHGGDDGQIDPTGKDGDRHG